MFLFYSLLSALLILIGYLVYNTIYNLYKTYKKLGVLRKYKVPLYKVKFKYNYYKYQVPLIGFRLQDRIYYFVLDTGANINIINKNFYDSNKYLFNNCQKDEEVHIYGLGNNVADQKTNLTMVYGTKIFKDTPMVVVDISNITDQLNTDPNKQIIGILGCKFMEEHSFKIDFSKLCLWLDRF